MGRLGVILGLAAAAVVIIIVLLYVFSSQSGAPAQNFPSSQSLPSAASPAASSAASKYPPGLVEGNVVGAGGLGIWLLTPGGTRRHYSPEGYAAAGSPAYTMISADQMNAIPVGGPSI